LIYDYIALNSKFIIDANNIIDHVINQKQGRIKVIKGNEIMIPAKDFCRVLMENSIMNEYPILAKL
jgi:hypothetical protein